MAGSGSAWIRPKKQKGLRAAAITRVPHPTSVRPGQRYFPLNSRARNAVTLRVVRVPARPGACQARREDASTRLVLVDRARLLKVDDNGAGVHYRFVGYASRIGYRTHACVVAVDGEWARLVCPEWHPAIAITVATGGLPPTLRAPGAWVVCKGDLGATAPAKTGLRDFMAPATGFDPTSLHPVALVEPDAGPDAPLAEDVVLFVSQDCAREATASDQGVDLTGHVPPTGPGRRAYLCVDGIVTGWRAVAAVRPTPTGSRILLAGPWNPIAVSGTPVIPPASVADGRFGRQLWTRRFWAIEDERPAV